MDKVILTKEQAQALERFMELKINDKENAIRAYLTYHESWEREFLPLREMGFNNFISALYFGYEVETPEERIKKMFDNVCKSYEWTNLDCTRRYYAGVKDGITDTLNLLGIKIEGIN